MHDRVSHLSIPLLIIKHSFGCAFRNLKREFKKVNEILLKNTSVWVTIFQIDYSPQNCFRWKLLFVASEVTMEINST